ncbi:hypothetical protein BSKO_02131 [Bryopsis sp. KO-2023]|nr:hypothetical protein BSKO_02131 [Bryopsis sp. KO-2023]
MENFQVDDNPDKENGIEMEAFPALDLPPFLEVLDELGRGGQARVVRANDQRLVGNDENGNASSGQVAVKCYPRAFIQRPDVIRRLKREVTNHRGLSHLHVVGFREVRVTRNYLVMLLNYVSGGTLKEYVVKEGRLDEKTARWIFQQIALGVDYCHKRSVTSRDISLDNVLYSESEQIAILCDFGLSRTDDSISKSDESGRPLSMVGKQGYVAPELVTRCSGTPTPEDVKRSDIFACGVCLYKMLIGADEFPLHLRLPVGIPQDGSTNSPTTSCRSQSEFLKTLRNLVETGGVDFMAPYALLDLSSECKAFLNNVLNFNPEQRYTMNEIWTDPWFREGLPDPTVRSYNEQVSDTAFLDDQLSVLQTEQDLVDRVLLAARPDFVPDGYWF